MIDRAYEKQMTIILNPSPYDSGLDSCDLTKVSVFLINEVEGRQISGYAEPQKILDVMREKFPASKIVLTLGWRPVLCTQTVNSRSGSPSTK